MIRRIHRIEDFGVFQDYRWPDALPNFKQLNLLYGWNYAGKTTVSRIFRCFEQKTLHADFAGAQVQLMDNSGTIHHLSSPHSAPVFRVFNSDFIRENLSFEDGSASPILVLGAEDIAKQRTLTNKRNERDGLNSNLGVNLINKKSKQEYIDKQLTRYARDFIKIPLAEVNYDKRRFLTQVKNCMDKPYEHILSENDVSKYLAIHGSKEKKPSLSLKTIKLTPFLAIKDKVALLLARTVRANVSIQRLKDNPAIEAWVNEGRVLHDGRSMCEFCGQVFPSDLLTRLTGHFSADYDDMLAKLHNLEVEIKKACDEDPVLEQWNDFYPEFVKCFTDQKTLLNDAINLRTKSLRILEDAIVAKRTKVFTSVDCPHVVDPTDDIATYVEAINNTIAEHNQRTEVFDANRHDAFRKLERHYASLFAREEGYIEVVRQISDLEIEISEQNRKISDLNFDIRQLEEELSDAAKGAERINELLAAYFGKNDLRIEVSAENRFQISRGYNIAKNLSEGEKTAIAFAYFITRVHDGRYPLSDMRVVIDDPISSLDSNHLFNTYAMIKTQLVGCQQLFLSTHSYEFFNLIREWVAEDERDTKKPQADWKKWGVFLVKRTDHGTSTLEEIPKELLKFKSEYHFLFSTLYHFNRSGAGDFNCLLSLPNIVRRYMEAFGGVMIPRSTGLKGKLDRIFPDPILRERIWKFINHYSHNTTITRSLTIPDLSECTAVVEACLNAVKRWNEEYFHDLEKEVE
jgi:wobble nucleotide-excising tRNase